MNEQGLKDRLFAIEKEKKMTNESLRKCIGIKPSNFSLASRIIRDAIRENLVKPQGKEIGAGKSAFYPPFWA